MRQSIYVVRTIIHNQKWCVLMCAMQCTTLIETCSQCSNSSIFNLNLPSKLAAVDDRTEPKIPKFRCFGNFGSVRFGSVRLEKTEPKQIAEFRFKRYTVGKKIEKKSSSKSFRSPSAWRSLDPTLDIWSNFVKKKHFTSFF